jgi:probable HAF family extracellular repeat protein
MQITPAIVRARMTRLVSTCRRGARTLAAAATALSAAVLAVPGTALAAPIDASSNYTYQTLNNDNDTTFNQLLGINDSGVISGYFGSGQPGHPNMGYELLPNYFQGNYRNENVPHSAQTQVTGLNNSDVTVGFWVDNNGNNNGFYAIHRHHFHTVDFPTSRNASPQVDQLLGVNDNDVAVGFYTDKAGVNHGYSYNIRTQTYRRIKVPGDTNLTAAAINDLGDVAGFATNSAGATEGFLLRSDGKLFRLSFPGASATQAFGVNNGDEVVGQYTDSGGKTHGFVWAPGLGFENVDAPNASATTINGVNDRGDLVGFYTDSAGNTDGLLATP